jgi:phosphatidylglycerol---prolipoprotein diacylglyceryl transferase
VIPYLPQPILTIGPLTIHAFGVCTGAALLTGYFLVDRRAERFGVNRDLASGIYLMTVVAGLLGGLFWSAVTGVPGISSTGLLLGGFMSLILMTQRVASFWRTVDLYAFALPIVLTIARFGCFLAHDHVGRLTHHWLGVQFPGGARFDLGLVQAMLAAMIAGVLICLSRKPVPAGLVTLITVASLAISRFAVLTLGAPAGYGWLL